MKSVVIVGGTSGLGLGVAKEFLNFTNYEVCIGSRSDDKIKHALEDLNSDRVIGYPVDITSHDSLIEFFKKVKNVDCLIITASSSFADKPLKETNIEEIKDFLETKLWGTLRCIKDSIPYLNENASITLVSGAVSKKGRPGAHAKTISNASIEGLTRSIAVELAPKVRVNCVSPAIFDSKGVMLPDKKESLAKQYPLEYVGTSKDVAALVHSVATNAFMTGATIYIDSGWTAL